MRELVAKAVDGKATLFADDPPEENPAEERNVLWVSDDVTLTKQPAASMLQRIEDWFFAHLPLEKEL
jgi:hypothetical protein